MSRSTLQQDVIPRPLLLGMGGLVAFSLVVATWGALTKPDPAEVAVADAAHGEAVRFADLLDGSLLVLDAAGDPVETIPPGEGGFVRSVMRGFVRERRAMGLGPERPFRLAAHGENVILTDPATGRMVQLAAFGPDQVAAFARLIPSEAVR